MANLEDLKTVLKDTLEQKGVLGEIKAKIRSEIFTALDNDSVPKSKISNQNMIINELIRDYLRYNKHYHTLSVFLTETGQPQEPPFDRNYISKQVNVASMGKGKRLPLIYERKRGEQLYDLDLAFGQKKSAQYAGASVKQNYQHQNFDQDDYGDDDDQAPEYQNGPPKSVHFNN